MANDAQGEFVNAFIDRQQRAIADLTNKVIMMETQLLLASKRITELEAQVPKQEDEFKPAEMKQENADSNQA